MSEQHEEQAKSEEKVYPGNLARYVELRNRRLVLEDTGLGAGSAEGYAAACIAEELAGLSYILDGIRYSARQGQRS
jgi:hypothetical protein